MFIKEIILDGFKSYATRTVVKGFDPKFNAITGLNGSGKSNILDSICFVLGITQLSHVRVSSLQGLVYKNGQAGITKASVSIVFDNTDKAQSPLGYEADDEIVVTRVVVIGGKNKYLINGKTSQASQVQNLFHSVQLNVNNPHFLIMQGRITKVLNMKPFEILGMVEEAAGTRMYQLKKEQAEKTMKKKQVELDEIIKVLTQEASPKLEKLRQEKRDYLKFSSVQEEIERSENFCIAFKYYKSQQKEKELSLEIEKHEEKRSELESIVANSASEKAKIEKKIQKFSSNINAKQKESIKELRDKEQSTAKLLSKTTTQLENAEKQLARSIDAHNKIEETETRLKSTITELKGSENELEEAFKTAESSLEEARALQVLKQDNLQAVSSGLQLAENGEKALTLTDALMKAKDQLETTRATNKELALKTKHAKADLKSIEATIKKNGKNTDANVKELEHVEKKLKVSETKILESLHRLNVSKGNEEYKAQDCETIVRQAIESSELNRIEKEKEFARCRNELNEVSSKVKSVEFRYDRKNVGFSPKEIKGIIAQLISLKDIRYSQAIESVAGGKLFNLVVSNDQVGKELLDRGRLKRRTTILPINRIRYRPIPRRVIERAKEIGRKENAEVSLAFDLLEFDNEINNVIGNIFGQTLVCSSLSAARKIAFDREVRMRVVTIDGDVVDPSGVLSGGSRKSKSSIMQMFARYSECQSKYNDMSQDLDSCKNVLSSLKEGLKGIERDLIELKKHEKQCSTLQAQILTSEQGQLEHKRKTLLEDIENNNSMFEQNTKRIKSLEKEIVELEAQKNDKGNAQKKALKEAELQLKEAKSELKRLEKEYQKRRKNFEGNKQELKRCQDDLKAIYKERDELKETIASDKSEVHQKEEAKASLEETHEGLKQEIMEKEKILHQDQAELGQMQIEMNKIDESANSAKLELQKGNGSQERLSNEIKELKQLLKKMTKQCPWISRDCHKFGEVGGPYEFKKKNLERAEAKLSSLKESKDDLSRSLNKGVMGKIERAETEYKDLNDKRKIIEKDKASLERTIRSLDDQKNKTLYETYEKVNKDFGSIFSTLLKGAEAKLIPYHSKKPDGKNQQEGALEGLEVKVAFSKGVWKESLSELSGGQRSLLALSLILSFLLFKPAPMYILDEVDAALDLSHTQNIGLMLRKHFKQSQFIVVSLKEGMFNNANVIFRTKFVDGVSTVRRTLGHKNSSNKKADKESNSNNKENIALTS